MTKCTDPFVEELKKRGYSLIAYPKTSIKALHVYQSNIESKILRTFVRTDLNPMNGFLKEMFSAPEGAIGLNKGKGINLDSVITQKTSTDISAKILTNYINTLLLDKAKRIDEPMLKTLFTNTKSVTFKLEDIETVDVNEISLRNWLNSNEDKLIKIYEEEIKNGMLYIATSLLKPKKITMTFERNNTAKIAADLANIVKLPIEGSFKLDTKGSENDKLLYNSEQAGIVVGIKLVRLKYSPNGSLTCDNKQDFRATLGDKAMIEPEYYQNDETFVDVG